jgi:predicted permease
MGIPIVLGRDLSRADFDLPARSAVVNETFVRKYLAGRNPVGQVFEPPRWGRSGGQTAWFTIVGVSKDAHYRGVREEVPPTAYLAYPFRASGDTRMVFAVRVRQAPGSFAAAVREAVASVDSNLPVAEMRTERDQIDRSLGAERLFASLMSAFGAMAMVLAAIGLYGVMAFAVTRRTPEIGIRIALGAQRSEVQWLVLRQSLVMALWGIVVGVPGALALARLIRTMLYGVEPSDPASIAGAVLVIAVVAALAAWIPARRAASVDPMKALRNE